jgi:hypothetical protein
MELSEQGPFAILLTGMMLLGSFVNMNSTDSLIEPREFWCTNNTVENKFPQGFDVAAILSSVIFPILPIILNSQSKKWNDFKIEMVKSHAMGQGSVFGVSELLRHFVIVPEPTFLDKCNISLSECKEKAILQQIALVDVNGTNSFCQLKNNTQYLFDSMHHFPDKISCLIGASIVTFLANLYFWNNANTKGKSIYEATALIQIILILVQIICIVVFLMYLYMQYSLFDGIQLYGVFIGGVIQLMIIFTTLIKK